MRLEADVFRLEFFIKLVDRTFNPRVLDRQTEVTEANIEKILILIVGPEVFL